jgi:hypothetical protein
MLRCVSSVSWLLNSMLPPAQWITPCFVSPCSSNFLFLRLKMRSFYLHTALAALLFSASAFPHVTEEVAARLASAQLRSAKKRAVTFSPAAQLVDVTGKHAFVPPNFAAGDTRGPCPGLNALANHNYIPHNGVAAWTDIANQTVSGTFHPQILPSPTNLEQFTVSVQTSRVFSPSTALFLMGTFYLWTQGIPSEALLQPTKIF